MAKRGSKSTKLQQQAQKPASESAAVKGKSETGSKISDELRQAVLGVPLQHQPRGIDEDEEESAPRQIKGKEKAKATDEVGKGLYMADCRNPCAKRSVIL